MITHMLDTDTCVYIIRWRPLQVISRLRRRRVSSIGISSITLSELEYGAAKSAKPVENRLSLDEFLCPLEIASYDDAAAYHYGELRARLERLGTPVGALDLWIAAHALSLRCVLVTNNEAEFKRVPGLTIENWV